MCEPLGRVGRSKSSGEASLSEPTAVIPRSRVRSRRRSTSHTTVRERCFGGYWNALAFWRTDPEYRFGMYLANTDGHIRAIFQTDHDLIGSLPPVEEGMTWRGDPDAALINPSDFPQNKLKTKVIAPTDPLLPRGRKPRRRRKRLVIRKK